MRTSDTKEPIFYGSGLMDAKVINGGIQLGLQTELGWIVCNVPIANATLFAAHIASLAGGVLMASNTEAGIPRTDNTTLH